MLKRLLMPLMLILLLPQFMRAQDVAVYPIDVNAIITPPHGTCLKDYVGSRRFMVNVLLRDMTKRPDDFVVEMSVKNAGGRVVFRSYFGNLSLHPGKPAYLDSEIQNGFISQLFNENNISIGRGYATKCFEEGAYTISFQAFSAYHYPQRRIALSRASATTLFMQSTVQGPYLIYPYNKDSIACSETVINFQWQSANPTGEPLSYQLQVAEVPEGVSANRAFEQNSVLVEDVQNLYHSIYQSVKTEGKYKENTTYAWRVLVNKPSGESHISPVYTFVYCGTPQVPEPEIPYDPVLSSKRMDYSLDSLHIDSVDTVSITPLAYWKNKPEIAGKGYCGIGIEVRKQGQDKWTPYIINTVDTTKFQLSNLSYGTLYEIRGQYIKCGEQDTLYGPYGDTLQFIIPDPNRAADCGDDIPPLTDCGDSKGKIMRVGDTINANGTSVIIDSLSYDEKDSTIITGKGHIEFPIIKNIRLWTKFEKIQINCAGELAKGNIVSIYDPRTAAMIDLEELTGENSTGGGDNPVANSTTEAYSKEKFDAAPAGSFFTKGDTVVMKDGSGNEVIIGREISLSSDEYASRNALADDAHFLEFRNDIDPDNVAFDNDKDNIYSRIDQGKEGYQKFSNAGGRNYIIPWLANNPGKLKPLSVKDINLKGGSLFDSVKFVMPTNGKYIELSCETTGEGEYKISIPGGAGTRNSFEVYALGKMKGNSSYQDAGKLLIANYAPRTQKVIIVPVLKEYAVSPDMEQQLNQIYGRLGVSYEVVLDKVFTEIDTVLIDSLENGLKIGADDESRWQVETQEMKRLRYSYQLAKGDALDKNAAYIFLVEKAEEPYEGVEGDMPRNQSVGYIFMNGKESLADGRLVAHELGHGVYKLQHTFAYKQLAETKGKTDNLMDYNGGSFLAHYQWRVMQDSVMFVWKVLQEDEDGMKTGLFFTGVDDYLSCAGFNNVFKFLISDNEAKRILIDLINSDDYAVENPEGASLCIIDALALYGEISYGKMSRTAIKIGDEEEAVTLIKKFKEAIFYEGIQDHLDDILAYLESNPNATKQDIENRIIDYSSTTSTFLTGLSAVFEMVDACYDVKAYFTDVQLRGTVEKTRKMLVEGKMALTQEGLKNSMLNMSNRQFKDYIRWKDKSLTNKAVQQIMVQKKIGVLSDLIKDIVDVSKIKAKDYERIFGKMSDLSTFRVICNDKNFQGVQTSPSVPGYIAKVAKVAKGVNTLGTIANLIFSIEVIRTGQDISPANIVGLIPHPVALFSYMMSDYVDKSVNENTQFILDSGGWDMVYKWNEYRVKKKQFYPDHPLYLHYVRYDGSKNNVYNKNVFPTSIVINDKRLATKIFGFEPSHVIFYLKDPMYPNGQEVVVKDGEGNEVKYMAPNSIVEYNINFR